MTKTAQIRKAAADLLERQQVSCVIGYETGTHGHVRPTFVYQPEDIERLVWNEGCSHNLTRYLLDKREQSVAIVVKPCDARAINVLLAERKVSRNHLYIIGIACEGILSGGVLQTQCQTCNEHTPVLYDILVDGEPETHIPDNIPTETAFQELDSLSPSEKMDYWLSQFNQCIRCYACRQACPVCSCPTCIYEGDDSLWVGPGIGLTEKRSFHLGRAFHLAGRCVGCNECERVCPVDLPISLLNQKLHQEIVERFHFTAGLTESLSPLTTVLSPEEVHG